MTNEELYQLTQKYLNGTLTDEEALVFNIWWKQHLGDQIIVETGRPENEKETAAALLARIKNTNTINETKHNKPGRVKRILLTTAAAASIIAILFFTSRYLLPQSPDKTNIITASKDPLVIPGQDKAILTLSDGRQINLNNNDSTTITDANLSIKNNFGELLYDSARGSISPFEKGGSGLEHDVTLRGGFLRYNTMSTPKNAQYKLTLSDGTQVWLNAASSITYPVTFNNKTREVSITGEAYFEVSSNKSVPFTVKSAHQTIEVLGTAFNINAYTDEPQQNTTLITGSVRIKTISKNIILQPGKSASTASNEINITNADISRTLAWKNGYFSFKNTSLPELMRQLSRWYDIEVIYEGSIPNTTFNGGIKRNASFASILEYLRKQQLIVTQKGKQITITSKK
jgi:transmembrane sensor